MKTEIIFDGQYGGALALSNAAAEGAWTRIATYGDVPNRTPDGERVVQRFERSDAERIVATFANNWARIKRLFGVGSGDIPVVRGHTDTGNVDESTVADTTQYGRITALEARDDGLYARISKSPEFGRLLANGGHLEYSPTWRVEESGDKVYRPFRLISLGMVPKGNLRDATLVNAISGGSDGVPAEQSSTKTTNSKGKDMEWTDEQKERLAEVLGTDAGKLGDAEAVIASVSGKLPKKAEAKPKNEEKKAEDEPKKKTASNAAEDAPDEADAKPAPEAEPPAPKPAENEPPKADGAEAAREKARTLVNAAFADETIFASEVEPMTRLAESDYAQAESLLAARRAKLAEKPRSAVLENAAETAKKKERAESERDAKIAVMVNARIDECLSKGVTPPKPHVLWAQCEAELGE